MAANRNLSEERLDCAPLPKPSRWKMCTCNFRSWESRWPGTDSPWQRPPSFARHDRATAAEACRSHRPLPPSCRSCLPSGSRRPRRRHVCASSTAFENFVAHARGDAGIDINHARSPECGRETRVRRRGRTPCAHRPKRGRPQRRCGSPLWSYTEGPLGGSLRFQGQHFAVVAHQRDGGRRPLAGRRRCSPACRRQLRSRSDQPCASH